MKWWYKMGRARKARRFVADTESTTPKTEGHIVHHLDSVRVWGVGLCEIGSNDVSFYTSLQSFLDFLDTVDFDSIIYFHNLKWDIAFFLDWWARHGWAFAEMDDVQYWTKPPERVIFSCISNLGAVYSVKFLTKRGRVVEFRDSLKILPFTVEQIGKKFGGVTKLTGSIDYSADRPKWHILTDAEKAYIAHDVLIISNALAQMEKLHAGILDALTIGSFCMKDFRSRLSGVKIMKDFTFRKLFPRDIDDTFFRRGYRGGWCYVNERYQDKIIDNVDGRVYDVNSLYPAMMLKDFPAGGARAWRGDYSKLFDSDYHYFVHFEAEFSLKKNKFPFLQDKTSLFRDTSHISQSNGVMELTLSRPDFELFLENYDVNYMEIFEGRFFEGSCSPFHRYIDYWRDQKITADQSHDEILRTFSKLMLNNLYGKFAQSPQRRSKYPYYDEDSGLVRFEDFISEGGGGYIPIGAYITAYARGVIVRAAQENYDNFLYADTDSLHMIGEPRGIDIDPVAFGAFKHESNFTAGRYVRQKTYIELLDTGEYEIRAAGMPQVVKDNFLASTDKPLDDFTRGLEVFGKLMKKRVSGGAYLYPSTFKVR